jgi:hypothetical protein
MATFRRCLDTDLRGKASKHFDAVNCVYHDLAAEHRQVRPFDLALLSNLANVDVMHKQSSSVGDHDCRFGCTN